MPHFETPLVTSSEYRQHKAMDIHLPTYTVITQCNRKMPSLIFYIRL